MPDLQVQKPDETYTKGLVALGSNLPTQVGSVSETIKYAFRLLAEIESISVVAESRMFQTPAFPAGSGPDYINAALCFETHATPGAVLRELHMIESELGRVRDKRWEARGIDLDLLAFGQQILPDRATYLEWLKLSREDQAKRTPDQLVLPHPRMQDRAFVLVPLMDVAPEWRHPLTDLTVRQMVSALAPDDVDQIRVFDEA